ncbi:hypothetical protein [Vibrio aestuarianus]|uniref:hypothetical protein n=1 Tax=Vibrio aestuarianus TaxID=28171 RepID=UPI00237CA99A|nr:hypothetical protein [Vibrio aestuarianus]MDE1328596.1 hypothetical protein [Vibrio aestuarianus]
MRAAINATLIIFTLIIAFLYSVSSFAATCPIGDTPSLKWPPSTSRIASACIDGCRAVEGFNGGDTWTCSTEFDYCTGYFTTTGDTCTGSDDTDGSCDANGHCTSTGGGTVPDNPDDPHYTESIRNQLKILPDLISGLDSSSASLATALRINAKMAGEVAISTKTIAPRLADLTTLATRQENILSAMLNKDNPNYTEPLYSILSRLQSIDNKTGYDGGEGGSGLPDNQFNNLMGNIGSLNSSIYGSAGNIQTTLRNELNMVSMKAGFNKDEIVSAIENISAGGDNTNVINAINSQTGELKTGIDSLGKGIDKLNDFFDDGSFVSRPYEGEINFDSLKLYDQSLLDSVTNDIEDLRVKYDEQLKEFKSIFSLDVSQLQSGQYKEHSLDFILPNGQRLNLKSGVLPALIDQANLIAAIILFVASLIAARAIFGGRK